MRHNIVVDAGVLGLFFRRDQRSYEYLKAIDRGDSRGYVAGVNLAEFYYKTCRSLGRQTADARFYSVINEGLTVIDDEELSRLAGMEKCRRELDISLADCYALALTKRVNGLLLTTDSELGKTTEVETRHFPVE